MKKYKSIRKNLNKDNVESNIHCPFRKFIEDELILFRVTHYNVSTINYNIICYNEEQAKTIMKEIVIRFESNWCVSYEYDYKDRVYYVRCKRKSKGVIS